MKKKGFSDDGRAHEVDGWACRRQTHLLEEARVKTVSQVPTREFQRRTGEWRVWVRGKVFFGKASTGR